MEKVSSLEALARDASRLAWVESATLDHLSRTKPATVIVADSLLAEKYNDSLACLQWLSGAYRYWLQSNQRFNMVAERQIFYRYVLLPYPSTIKAWYRRRHFIDIVLLHLHVHLWHGVICGVVFVDPRSRNMKQIVEDFNFEAIPAHRTLIDTPAYYHSEHFQPNVLADNDADRRSRQLNHVLTQLSQGPIWLHYDEANFLPKRLPDWRWRSLRAFFEGLYGPRLRCSDCTGDLEHWALDHIAPLSKGFPQTIINLRPTCKSCNSAKGDRLTENPFRVKPMVPRDILTHELDDMLRLPPTWLGSTGAPLSLRELSGGGQLVN